MTSLMSSIQCLLKMKQDELKRIIEALLFASDRSLSVAQIKQVLEELNIGAIKSALGQLSQEYKNSGRSFDIAEIAGGYQIVTDSAYAPWLQKLYRKSRTEKLSHPALETLAIIAYQQPITRVEIEDIRGVNIDGVLKTLLERSMVRINGRKQILGRPFFYSTTRNFLEFFALQSLEDLPNLEEFGELALRRGEGDVEIKQPSQEDRPD